MGGFLDYFIKFARNSAKIQSTFKDISLILNENFLFFPDRFKLVILQVP